MWQYYDKQAVRLGYAAIIVSRKKVINFILFKLLGDYAIIIAIRVRVWVKIWICRFTFRKFLQMRTNTPRMHLYCMCYTPEKNNRIFNGILPQNLKTISIGDRISYVSSVTNRTNMMCIYSRIGTGTWIWCILLYYSDFCFSCYNSLFQIFLAKEILNVPNVD